MNYLNTILLGSLVFVTYASGLCFPLGPSWGSKVDVESLNAKLPIICRQLTGEYPAGSSASRCHPAGPPGLRYDFIVKNIGRDSTRLDHKQCMKIVSKDISTCPLGGSTDVGTWRFVSDPNMGACSGLPAP